ncbi:MAG TPA: class I SAM-dependent methyltransferase [Rhizomicrobium sp.]
MAAPGWHDFHRRWARLKPPQRPHPEAVEAYLRALEGKQGHALLLGVTPELADLAIQLTALDGSESMIAHIWPGDTQARRAIRGDWLAMPFGKSQFSAVIGDGSLNVMVYSDYAALFAQLARVLQPSARLALRIFTTPDVCESVTELRDQAFSSQIPSFHGFKWRLAMAIVKENGQPDLPVAQLHACFEREFPDRAALAQVTGWPEEDIDGIDAYAGNGAIYSFPTAREVIAAIPSSFTNARLLSSGSYELAERCPLLAADFHP